MSDVNYRSYADVDGATISDEIIDPPNWSEFSDILKFSKATNCVVSKSYIGGGKEDCVDMNRYCQGIVVVDTQLRPHGKFGMTIKGGTTDILVRNVEFLAHGSEMDIDIGNWSDQSAELTTRITLDNVSSYDGKPVRVRVLWGEKPTVIGGNVKVTVYPKFLVAIYRWLRKHNLVP